MQWDDQSNTWRPLSPPSNFPEPVAEIIKPAVEATLRGEEVLIQIAGAVKVVQEYKVDFTGSWEGKLLFQGTIQMPDVECVKSVAELRNPENGSSLLHEIALSTRTVTVTLELADYDSSCTISIPPDVPKNLQPNFTTLELVISEDEFPRLRFHRDKSIETDIPFKDYYDVDLASESANEEVEFYLGFQSGNLELMPTLVFTEPKLDSTIFDVNLDEPPNPLEYKLETADDWVCWSKGRGKTLGWGRDLRFHFTRVNFLDSKNPVTEVEELEFRDPSMVEEKFDGEVIIPGKGALQWVNFVCQPQDFEEYLAVLDGYKDMDYKALHLVRIFDEEEPSNSYPAPFVAQSLILDGKKVLCIHGRAEESSITYVEVTRSGNPPKKVRKYGDDSSWSWSSAPIKVDSSKYTIITISDLPFDNIRTVEIEGVKERHLTRDTVTAHDTPESEYRFAEVIDLSGSSAKVRWNDNGYEEMVESSDLLVADDQIVSGRIDIGRCMFCGLCMEACSFTSFFMTNEYDGMSGFSRQDLWFDAGRTRVLVNEHQEAVDADLAKRAKKEKEKREKAKARAAAKEAEA